MTTDEYKVGIYLRLSREDERLGESGSISTQRDLLLNYIRDNNLRKNSHFIHYLVKIVNKDVFDNFLNSENKTI